MVPIIHMNIRYFEIPSSFASQHGLDGFGGGIDVTPHYIIEEDARFSRPFLKISLRWFSNEFYLHMVQIVSMISFFIKHRDETRGIGWYILR